MLTLRERISTPTFDFPAKEGEVEDALRRTSDDFSRAERLSVLSRTHTPDLTLQHTRWVRVAIEVKFRRYGNDMATEVARGLGQCVMYGIGSPTRDVEGYDPDIGPYYRAAALVVFEGHSEPGPSVAIENVYRVRDQALNDFWVYHFRRRI